MSHAARSTPIADAVKAAADRELFNAEWRAFVAIDLRRKERRTIADAVWENSVRTPDSREFARMGVLTGRNRPAWLRNSLVLNEAAE